MSARNKHPEMAAAVRDALRREAFANVENGLWLYDGQWLDRANYRSARRWAVIKTLQHSIEAGLATLFVALMGVGLFLLIDAII